MPCDMFTGEHAAVAVADDDRIPVTFVGQIFSRNLIIFNAFGDGLIRATDALTAVVGAHGIVAAPIERHEIVAERGDMRREKPRGANVKVHLVAVAVYRRTL